MRLLIVIVSIVVSIGHVNAQNAAYIKEKAEQHLQNKNYKESLKEYNDCVKAFENESKHFKVEVMLNKAMLESRFKDYQKAHQSISEAISIKRNISSIYTTQARIYSEQNKNNDAAICIDSALKYNSEKTELLLSKAQYQMLAFSKDSALRTINKYIELEPKNIEAYVIRSTIYSKRKEYENGLKDVNYVLNHTPDHLGALLSRGYLSALAKNYDSAEKDFKRIVDLNYEYKTASINNIVFFIKFQKMEYKESLDMLNTALHETPEDAYLLSNRGYANLMLDKYEESINDIKASLKLDPYNSYAYKYLGLYYIKTGKKGKACTAFKKAIEFGYTTEHDNEVDELLKQNCN